MKRVMWGVRCGVAAMAGLLVAQGAAAQSMGTVSYAPLGATNVPTVSEWGLIFLAGLLALAAYHAMRTQGGRALKVWALGLVACGTLSAGLWNQPALAEPAPAEIALNQAAGGVADIPHRSALFFGDFFYIYTAENQTNQPQRITGVSVISGLQLLTPTGFTPECTVGLVLQPKEVCYIRVYNDSLPG